LNYICDHLKKSQPKEWKQWLLYHKPVTTHQFLRSFIERRCIIVTNIHTASIESLPVVEPAQIGFEDSDFKTLFLMHSGSCPRIFKIPRKSSRLK